MDSKSLMIGDWVYCFDPDEPNDKQINNVSAVRVEYNEGAIKFEQFTDWFEEGWFAPIPLTPEILEKNGFWEEEWDYGDLTRCGNNGKKAYRAFHTKERYFFVIGWSERPVSWRVYNNERMEIHYVHQIQQILRLCGMNDLADNFKI